MPGQQPNDWVTVSTPQTPQTSQPSDWQTIQFSPISGTAIPPPPDEGDWFDPYGLIPMGLRTVPAIAGSIMGGTAGTIVPGAGTIAGASVGGAGGSLIGETLGEGYEILRGRRESLNPWQLAIQTGIGAIPFFGKTPAANATARELIKYAVKAPVRGAVEGGVLGGAASYPTEWAETGEMPGLRQVGQNVIAGAGIGAVTGGVFGSRPAIRRARAINTPAPITPPVVPEGYVDLPLNTPLAAPEVKPPVEAPPVAEAKPFDPNTLQGLQRAEPAAQPAKTEIEFVSPEGEIRTAAEAKPGDVPVIPDGVEAAGAKVAAEAREAPVRPTLPPPLRGAKPRFWTGDRSHTPIFEDDLDKALYIIAQTRKSKADAKYLQWIMDNTGMTKEEAVAAGKQVKARVKSMVTDKNVEEVHIPSIARASGLVSPAGIVNRPGVPKAGAVSEYLGGKPEVSTGELNPANVKPETAESVTQGLGNRLKSETEKPPKEKDPNTGIGKWIQDLIKGDKGEYDQEQLIKNIVTLFRGGHIEHPGSSSIWKREGQPSRYFTTKREVAENFSQIRNEPLWQLDIPAEELAALGQHAQGEGIYNLPMDVARRAKEIMRRFVEDESGEFDPEALIRYFRRREEMSPEMRNEIDARDLDALSPETTRYRIDQFRREGRNDLADYLQNREIRMPFRDTRNTMRGHSNEVLRIMADQPYTGQEHLADYAQHLLNQRGVPRPGAQPNTTQALPSAVAERANSERARGGASSLSRGENILNEFRRFRNENPDNNVGLAEVIGEYSNEDLSRAFAETRMEDSDIAGHIDDILRARRAAHYENEPYLTEPDVEPTHASTTDIQSIEYMWDQYESGRLSSADRDNAVAQFNALNREELNNIISNSSRDGLRSFAQTRLNELQQKSQRANSSRRPTKTLDEVEAAKTKPASKRLAGIVGEDVAKELVSGDVNLEYSQVPQRTRNAKRLEQSLTWPGFARDQVKMYVPDDPSQPGMTVKFEDPWGAGVGNRQLNIYYRNKEGKGIGYLHAYENSGISVLAAIPELGIGRGKVTVKMALEAYKQGIHEPSGITSIETKNFIYRIKQMIERAKGEEGYLDLETLYANVNKLWDEFSTKRRVSRELDKIYDENVRPEEELSKLTKRLRNPSFTDRAKDLGRKLLSDETGSVPLDRLKELFQKNKAGTITPNEMAEAQQLARQLKRLKPEDLEPGVKVKERKPLPAAEQGFFSDIWNTPRSLQSIDLPGMTSAALRQSRPLAFTRDWFKAWGKARQAFGSDGAYKAINDKIKNMEYFKPQYKAVLDNKGNVLRYVEGPSIAEQLGIKMTDVITRREEVIASSLAERIPGYGRYVKASNRAYTAFLNDLRANKFTQMMDAAKALGRDPVNDLRLGKGFAEFANNATGRGSLKFGKYDLNQSAAATLLGDTLYSPRALKARLEFMNLKNYFGGDAMVRKEYWKGLARIIVGWGAASGLASLIPGVKVSLDPTNTDFGKIRIGNTRLDPGGGWQQLMVLLSREAAGGTTSSASGKFTEFGSNQVAPTRLSLVGRYLRNQLNPSLRFIVDMLDTTQEEPFDLTDRTLQQALPLYLTDIAEAAKDDDLVGMIFAPILSSLGIGSQTYEKGEFGKPKITPFINDVLGVDIPTVQIGR